MTTHDHRHHHGNLRQALIDAGFALLSEGGRSALTLRQTAARAGVSHAAPAHHFDGLPGLLTAIAAQAFAKFTAQMIAARDAAGLDPFARLNGICTGYIAFAKDHAGMFDLMFNARDLDRADPDLQLQSFAAYEVLRDACQPFATPERPGQQVETAVWSLVHGYALLGFATPRDYDRPFTQTPDFPRLLCDLMQRSA
ncbi:MAG: TetR/AcrR family transcriptional regulator [Microgenomates group bacterium]